MSKWMVLTSVMFSSVALAADSTIPQNLLKAHEEVDEHLSLLTPPDGDPVCPGKGTICTAPGAPTTAADSAINQFTRVLRPAQDRDSAPWTVEITSTLKAPTHSGVVVFLLYDAADPQAFANHEVAGLYQAVSPSLKEVAARLTLTPNDGYAAGHTYKVRIEQFIGKKEVVLAQGVITLK